MRKLHAILGYRQLNSHVSVNRLQLTHAGCDRGIRPDSATKSASKLRFPLIESVRRLEPRPLRAPVCKCVVFQWGIPTSWGRGGPKDSEERHVLWRQNSPAHSEAK